MIFSPCMMMLNFGDVRILTLFIFLPPRKVQTNEKREKIAEFYFDTAVLCLSLFTQALCCFSLFHAEKGENCAMKIYFYFHLGYFSFFIITRSTDFLFVSAFPNISGAQMLENNSCARNN